MVIYFDTEFTDLSKSGQLISIGLIAEDGRTFYGEVTDFDRNRCSDFVKENIIPKLWYKSKTINGTLLDPYQMKKLMPEYHFATHAEIGEKLKLWLDDFDKVQLVSDICYFDMIHFVDLFGTSEDLPKNVSLSCHDINADIAEKFGVSEWKAFNMSREEIITTLGIGNDFINQCVHKSRGVDKVQSMKHNSLYDALIIARIAHHLGVNVKLNRVP